MFVCLGFCEWIYEFIYVCMYIYICKVHYVHVCMYALAHNCIVFTSIYECTAGHMWHCCLEFRLITATTTGGLFAFEVQTNWHNLCEPLTNSPCLIWVNSAANSSSTLATTTNLYNNEYLLLAASECHQQFLADGCCCYPTLLSCSQRHVFNHFPPFIIYFLLENIVVVKIS